MITKEIPYHHSDSAAICGITTISKITPMDYAFDKIPEKCDLINQNPLLKDLLEHCFKIDYNERINIEEIMNHEIMDGFVCDCSVKCKFL